MKRAVTLYHDAAMAWHARKLYFTLLYFTSEGAMKRRSSWMEAATAP